MELDELLQQVHLGEPDLVDLRISQRLDMSEELLCVVSAPADDALSTCTSGMPWEVSRTVSFVDGWMAPLRGVVIALIDCAINYSLIRIFHLSERILSCSWLQGFG